jgi:hypothetical protein
MVGPGATWRWLLLGLIYSPAAVQTSRAFPSTRPSDDIPVVIRPWTPPDTPADGWTRKGPWEGSLGLGAITLDAGRHNTLGYFSVGGGYLLSDRFSAHLDFDLTPGTNSGFGLDEEGLSLSDLEITAFGGMGTLRFDVVRARPVGLYVDAGLGGFHTRRTFPAEGARDNWVKAAGIGIEFRATNYIYASVGARYARVSPRLFETRGTPAFNGVQYYAGLSFNW